jgi:hypothetical protein
MSSSGKIASSKRHVFPSNLHLGYVSGKMLAGIPPCSQSHSNHPTCPSQCLDDPYAKPGMVLWGKDQFGKETRYVPFPSVFSSTSSEKMPMRTKDLDVGGTAYWSNTTEALELAVPAYTQAIKNKEEETVAFARNKLALFIGKYRIIAIVEDSFIVSVPRLV